MKPDIYAPSFLLPHTLGLHTDVYIDTPSDQQVLQYVDATGKWSNSFLTAPEIPPAGVNGYVITTSGGATVWAAIPAQKLIAAGADLPYATGADVVTAIGAQPLNGNLTEFAALADSAGYLKNTAGVLSWAAVGTELYTGGATLPYASINAVLLALAGGTAVTSTELSYIDGLTSNAQAQIDGKALAATTVTMTAPLTGSGTLGANLTLGIPVASGSADGYLSSANWTTFNSKQAGHAILTALAGTTVAKGTIPVFTASALSSLTLGTDGYVLTADSTQTLGVKWAAASAGLSWTSPTTNKLGKYSGGAIVNSSLLDTGSVVTVDVATTNIGPSTASSNFLSVVYGAALNGALSADRMLIGNGNAQNFWMVPDTSGTTGKVLGIASYSTSAWRSMLEVTQNDAILKLVKDGDGTVTVGMGTSSPTARFHVRSTGTYQMFGDYSSGLGWGIGANSSGHVHFQTQGGNLNLGNGGTFVRINGPYLDLAAAAQPGATCAIGSKGGLGVDLAFATDNTHGVYIYGGTTNYHSISVNSSGNIIFDANTAAFYRWNLGGTTYLQVGTKITASRYLMFDTTSTPGNENGIGVDTAAGMVYKCVGGYSHYFYNGSGTIGVRMWNDSGNMYTGFNIGGGNATATVHARNTAAGQLCLDYSSGVNSVFTVDSSGILNILPSGNIIRFKNSFGDILFQTMTAVSRFYATSSSDFCDVNVTAGGIFVVNPTVGFALQSNGTTRIQGNATGIGVFNVTPVARASAYTQTYSTTVKTVPAALTDSTTGTPATTLVDVGAAFSQANINNNFASLNARLLEAFKLINAMIDDHQAYGWFQ